MDGILAVLPPVVLRRAGYFLKGKNLRSALVRDVGNAMGIDVQRLALPASILELVHTTTILHDDVIDETQARRGQKTVNRLLKSRIAIFAADLLFSNSMRRLHQWAVSQGTGGRRVERCFHRQIRRVCEGELIQDIRFVKASAPSEADCLEIARGKTGALFALSFLVPGHLRSCSAPELEWLEEAGAMHGVVFQLVDDIEDLAEDTRGEGGAGQLHHWTYASRYWNEVDPDGLDAFSHGGLQAPPEAVRQALKARVEAYARDGLHALASDCPAALEPVLALLRGRTEALLESR